MDKKKLNGIPPFMHELLKEHLITNTSSKVNNGQPNNAHKHKKKEGYHLFKGKMIIHVLVKANIMKGKEKFFLVKCNVHPSIKKINMLFRYIYINILAKYLMQTIHAQLDKEVVVST